MVRHLTNLKSLYTKSGKVNFFRLITDASPAVSWSLLSRLQ